MLAAGYDENVVAWVPTVSVGSRAWGVLAVGSPRPLTGMSAGAVGQFAGDDDIHRNRHFSAARFHFFHHGFRLIDQFGFGQ